MKRLFLLLLLNIPAWSPAARPHRAAPNFILLLADDLGWTGTSGYGSDLHRTPHIDRLAAQGMRFTQAYAACTVCSPTRAAVLTGTYPARLHLTDWISGQKRPTAKLRVPDWNMQLDEAETTLAEALKAKGYRTLQVGKWHLGGAGNFPEKHGFDRRIGTGGGSPPGGYHLPSRLYPEAEKGGYLTDRLTDETLKVMGEWKDAPFFIYFAYYTVHTPIQGRKDLAAQYAARIAPGMKHRNPDYAAMHQSQDESVGRILARLDELGLAEDTVILYSSDNGGLSHKMGKPTGITDNAPLRRGKGSSFEGGTRVPLIVKWPGVTAPGSVSSALAHSIDFLPTFLDIAGAPIPACDGISLAPVLKGERPLKREALYWHYPHYHAGGDATHGPTEGPYGAVRAGDWKLIEYYEDMRVALYDLKEDLGESRDLASARPHTASTLRAMLHDWRARVGAQMPTPNPDFQPQRKKNK